MIIYCVIVRFSVLVIHRSLNGYVFSLSICIWIFLYYRFQYYIFGVIWVFGEWGNKACGRDWSWNKSLE